MPTPSDDSLRKEGSGPTYHTICIMISYTWPALMVLSLASGVIAFLVLK